MVMGYVIEINKVATELPCPLCGDWSPARHGPVVVQRPSGDVVCEKCAEGELAALFIESRVLRDDTPIDYPECWPAIEARLSIDPGTDGEFSQLLMSVALQRDPADPCCRPPARP